MRPPRERNTCHTRCGRPLAFIDNEPTNETVGVSLVDNDYGKFANLPNTSYVCTWTGSINGIVVSVLAVSFHFAIVVIRDYEDDAVGCRMIGYYNETIYRAILRPALVPQT